MIVDAPNDPPVITSTPPGPAVFGYPYRYAVVANDPNGDPLNYRLDVAPSGMTINATTGLLEWTVDQGDGMLSSRTAF